jgi:hypothetical protein
MWSEFLATLQKTPGLMFSHEPKLNVQSDGTIGAIIGVHLSSEMPKVAHLGLSRIRSNLLPIVVLNQAGVDSGVIFERFIPRSNGVWGKFKLMTADVSVSGSCEGFESFIGRIIPHADSIELMSTKVYFDPSLSRPLRWSSEFLLKSAQ